MRTKNLFVVLALALLSFACATKGAKMIESDQALQGMIGKSFYAATNIIFRVDRVAAYNGMSSVNFINGDGFIPLGTEVTILKTSGERAYLLTASHGERAYIFNERTLQYTSPSANISRILSSDLSKIKADYKSLSTVDKFGVDSATVQRGMSKKGVLMSIGYPPEISTRYPMESDEWLYWKGRGNKYLIVFDKDGLVSGLVE